MKAALPALLALVLISCNESPPPAQPQKPRATEAVAAEPAPPPPPKVDLPRYVGRWAESKALCPQQWTRLWVDELLTSEQLRCQIMPHSAKGGDRKLRMICIELGQRAREEWKLSYPKPDTLKIQRPKHPARTLIRC